jgi:O-antigen ligase
MGCAAHALLGLYQAATGNAPFAELLQVPHERWVMPAPGAVELHAAGGLFYNRVRLSHVLAAGVAVQMGLWPLTQDRPRRVMLAIACTVTCAGLLATYGRAALGALTLTLLGAGVLGMAHKAHSNSRRPLLWAAVVLLAGMALTVSMVEPIRARLLSTVALAQNADRLFLWGRGAEIAMDHAPLGAGVGGYSMVRNAYYDRVDDSVQSRAMSHNLLLSLLAETGFLGLLAWLWLWWALYARAWRSRSPVALCGALGATTFHAATLAHDPLYQSECALAWGLVGALMVAREPRGSES